MKAIYSTDIAWQLITKVGVSYVGHMNDEVPEVNNVLYSLPQIYSTHAFLPLHPLPPSPLPSSILSLLHP